MHCSISIHKNLHRDLKRSKKTLMKEVQIARPQVQLASPRHQASLPNN